jgi:hypothetical protein
LKLVDFIIEKLMPIATEEDPEDSDSDSASRVSYKVLNAMATNIPPQKFFSTIMPFIMSYIQNPDANYRKASMMAFAVSVEGCTDIIASKLNELLPVVCQGLQDPQVIVRRAACMALGCLAEEMSADLAEHHQTLLPLVFNLVNDSNPDMIKHACNALDAILEGLGNDIVQYLPLLMEKLLFLLDNAPETETRATVIAAIGSAAHAGTEAFQPYFDNVFARILQLMSLKQTADDQLLRGVATDTAGAIASAVGADVFRPHVQQVMGLAIEQLELDLPRLRECSYALFSILARVFGEEFAPYLPSIVPAILNSCKTEEKNDNLVNDEIDLTNGMDEDLDEDFENFNYNSAIADEKEFAADALGELFEHTKTQFLPFVEPALEELHALCAHIGDGVRKAAIISMATFLRTFYVISNPASPWQPGLPPTYTVHENVQHMIAGVIPTFLVLWKEEDDRMVSAQICQELVSILREVGPVAIAECLEEVSQDTLDIFRKQSLCQQDYDDEELVDEEDDLESETVLISSASDLVAALCETVGPSFASYFEVFMPLIAKYFKPTKTQTERSMAIGCLGECVSGMKQNITPHTEFLYSTFMKACSDEDELVRSNAAFALGSLVLYTQVDLSE